MWLANDASHLQVVAHPAIVVVHPAVVRAVAVVVVHLVVAVPVVVVLLGCRDTTIAGGTPSNSGHSGGSR